MSELTHLTEERDQLIEKNHKFQIDKVKQIIQSTIVPIIPPRKIKIPFTDKHFAIYAWRTVPIFFGTWLIMIMKYIFLNDMFPFWITLELYAFAIFCGFYIHLCFYEVPYVYHRTQQTATIADFDLLKNEIYCHGCLTFKDENVKHCWACKCCVKNYAHHCGFLAVCVDKYRMVSFIVSCAFWGFLALVFNIMFLGNFTGFGTHHIQALKHHHQKIKDHKDANSLPHIILTYLFNLL